MREEADTHRLWYDLRNQAQFGAGFGDTIVRIDDLLEQMVWAILSRYAELAGRESSFDPRLGYAVVDGIFQHALLRLQRGDAEAADRLRSECRRLIIASA